MSKIVYIGFFLNQQLKGPLTAQAEDQHVTFLFKPSVNDLFPSHLLGKEFEFEIIGEGNDGKNHGYEVKIPEELVPFYKGQSNPHITVSMVEGAKAVDTGKIKYKKIKPFKVKGKLGHFTYKGILYK